MKPCNTICMYLYLYESMLVIVLSLPSLSLLSVIFHQSIVDVQLTVYC